MNDMNEVTATYDRRGMFRIGGLTIAAAAIMAACADNSIAGDIGRVGTGATTPKLPDPIVNDSVLLRTSASIELSTVEAYKKMLAKGWLTKKSATFPNLGDQTALVTIFIDHHTKAAEGFNQLAQEAGGQAWNCGNPRLDSEFIDRIFSRVDTGVAATDNTMAVPPSDDPTRDMINLVYTLESLSAAASQALMTQVTQPSFRAEAMRIAVRSARQATLTSLKMNPGAYVTDADAQAAQPGVTTTVSSGNSVPPPTVAGGAPLTDIPLPVAIPTQYGSLSGITWIGGMGDENGVRLKLIFETPSLNSFTYPFDSCAGDTATTTTKA
ncbi:MAG: hypothetical protein WCI22_09840 [Actinomycetota bacterium]